MNVNGAVNQNPTEGLPSSKKVGSFKKKSTDGVGSLNRTAEAEGSTLKKDGVVAGKNQTANQFPGQNLTGSELAPEKGGVPETNSTGELAVPKDNEFSSNISEESKSGSKGNITQPKNATSTLVGTQSTNQKRLAAMVEIDLFAILNNWFIELPSTVCSFVAVRLRSSKALPSCWIGCYDFDRKRRRELARCEGNFLPFERFFGQIAYIRRIRAFRKSGFTTKRDPKMSRSFLYRVMPLIRVHIERNRRLLTSATEELSPDIHAAVYMTDNCVRRLKELNTKEESFKGKMLRLSVETGGCSGFQYAFLLDEKKNEDDRIFEKDGVKLVVDDISYDFVKGATVDYVDELIRSGFQVTTNPSAVGGCSCKASFMVK
ncbi:hypothetical protein IEQ34_010277 [Dendrobium chrysotoxum]|uniref:Core domain-containing protein n=2 Tax=Dendrobium TaxID=37818 RepID=A0AAV7H1F7_DENCH|nr:hypothetical protein IEQ34_010277 [Dendrobium chrysotoxum]